MNDSRERLISALQLVTGRDKAEQLVADLESTVEEAATEAATEATTSVVKKGLILSSVIGGVTLLGTFLVVRKRG